MEQILNIYLSDLELNNFSTKTIKTYRNNLLQLIRHLNSMDITNIEDIAPLHIKQFIAFKRENNCSAVYINNLLKCYRPFFNWCIDMEYIEVNPMTKIKNLKAPKPIIQTFTESESKAMMEYYKGSDFLSIRNKTIVTLLFESGIRANELCNITIRDLCSNYIIINGKGNKQRIAPISMQLLKQLNKYMRYRSREFEQPNDWLFLSRNNNKLTVEILEVIIRDCGVNVRKEIRCSPHTIRHYYAQKQILNKIDIYRLSLLLGHNSVEVTQTYLRSLDKNLLVLNSIKE